MKGNDFLGNGWKFPVALDEQAQISMVTQEECIQQAIWMILGTARGERVMRPDFGCGIHDLVFAINNAGTAGRISSEVHQSLLEWEPRIDVLDVTVSTKSDQTNLLLIKIDYRVRSSNNRFNLVYPFYLE
ncbi:MAG: GPW/gp25 family protein [Anaerolineaceae bacterium]|nr:GPW/gp25 family protein [Anaerolineaceae bacterium]